MKPSAIRRALPRLIEKRRPVFMWGAPGVGKSDLVAAVAKDMKYELRDVRLSLLDPVDMKGFPVPNIAKKQMNWLPADFLPTKGKGILFLDEMNSAPQATQASAYQLILNRKIGEYELPAGWAVVAAGNRMGDRSVTHAQPAALANRFVHLDFEVNNDDWNVWAMNAGIHNDVRAFLRFRPALLHAFDPAHNPRSFPSPRSWAFVNDIYKDHATIDDEMELIKGTIGEGPAAEFLGFTRQIKDLPTVEEVLLDPEKTRLPDQPSAKYAIVTALESKATKATMDRIMKYVTRIPEVEFQAVFVRGAIRHDDSVTQTKSYADWGIKNKEILIG
jgi:hypothetical protein